MKETLSVHSLTDSITLDDFVCLFFLNSLSILEITCITVSKPRSGSTHVDTPHSRRSARVLHDGNRSLSIVRETLSADLASIHTKLVFQRTSKTPRSSLSPLYLTEGVSSSFILPLESNSVTKEPNSMSAYTCIAPF